MAESQDIREQRAADALAAIGNRTRLRIFKVLVRAGDEGVNVGSIQKALGVPPTTLAHHLAALTSAGLVIQERRGREVICTTNYKELRAVLAYVMSECCLGNADSDECKTDAA